MKLFILILSLFALNLAFLKKNTEQLWDLYSSIDHNHQNTDTFQNSFQETPIFQHSDTFSKKNTTINLIKEKSLMKNSPRFFDVSFEKNLKNLKARGKGEEKDQKVYTVNPKLIEKLLISPDKKLMNTLNGIIEDISDYKKKQ